MRNDDKQVDKYLPWMLNNIHTLSDEGLSKLAFAVWVEQQDRKYDSMFDNDDEEGEQ